MSYSKTFIHLKQLENYNDNEISLDDNIVMRNYSFESKYRFLLPGGIGNHDDYKFTSSEQEDYEPDIIQEMLNKNDSEIMENIKFRYHIMMPRNEVRSNKIILLFHGFNEKYWSKYLPWAKYIVEKTGKTVIFFPIAFHMNRAPAIWSDTHEMYKVSEQRKTRHPDVICSSLSNVAISTRLHNKPQRFIWSGLQTYYDIIDFIDNIKEGKHPAIKPEASIDFFSYSVGTFLGQILMMTNPKDYFSQSKYVSFCGGAVFNRLSPVSKFILDSEADVSLYSYLVEHLESHKKNNEILRHYMGTLPEGINFCCMLNYKVMADYREDCYRKMADRFYTIALEKDQVEQPYEIINTLNGIKRDIPIKIDILDYPYKYIHEDPFPIMKKFEDDVDKQFKLTFDKVSDFLK